MREEGMTDNRSFVTVTYREIEENNRKHDSGRAVYFTAVDADCHHIFTYSDDEKKDIREGNKVINLLVIKPDGDDGSPTGRKIYYKTFFDMSLDDIKKLSNTRYLELLVLVEDNQKMPGGENREEQGF